MVVAAAILALGLVLNALLPRYEAVDAGGRLWVLDRWTGEVCSYNGRCFPRG